MTFDDRKPYPPEYDYDPFEPYSIHGAMPSIEDPSMDVVMRYYINWIDDLLTRAHKLEDKTDKIAERFNGLASER